ncbi:MAG TPA: ABC transporter substrate-binding protein [Chloroflexota bacterium]|nr:ABC transporter substrate-binding protein [Chloroflexota bacterium]
MVKDMCSPLLWTVLLALLLGACSGGPAAPSTLLPTAGTGGGATGPATALPTVHLKVGTIRIIADAGMYIAQERGYFKEQGLEIEFVDFVTAAEAIAPLGAGQLDIAVGAVGAGLFNAVGRGIDIKLVADKAATSPDPHNGFSSSLALAIPKEYAEGQVITDYRDLRGKILALPSRGTTSHVLIDRALQKGGLTLADIEIKEMSFPDMNAALVNKGIDVALQIEPLLSMGEAQGVLVRWKRAEEIYPGQQVAAIIYGPRIAAIGQNVGNRFMVAYIKGLRDYNDAFGPRRKDRAAVVSILTQYTNVKEPALYDRMTFDYMNPDGYINAEALAADLDWFVANGYLRERPDLRMVVDNRYVDYALQQLGRYQP